MIKQWFTTREFAELNLTGLPSTQQGMLAKAERDQWKSRVRTASGGGKEYHISNLPDKAQMQLIDKLVGTDAIKPSPSFALDKEAPKITAEDRRNARLIIVALYKKFIETSGVGVMAAEKPFMKFYAREGNDPASKLVPDWVYDIYPTVSARTLHRWKSSIDKADKLSAVTDKYGNRKGTGVLERAENGEVAQYIKALVTHNGHLKAGHVRDMCAHKYGWTVKVKNVRTGAVEEKPLPKIRTFERFIEVFKRDNEDIILKLTDPDAYKNKMQMATGKADAGIFMLNQLWEIDASPADVLCKDGRYNLYAIVDVFSRRSIFLVSKTPTTEASLLLIRKAIMKWGVPREIKTDNGADFISKRFMSALIELGIQQDICSPFSPEKKPFVERVFGTLHRELGPILPGFIGHDVADRKKIEAKKAFSARLGESDHKAFAVGMSAEDLQKHIDNWASGKYEHRTHSSLGVSPFEKANSYTGAIKTITNERALDLLLSPIASGQGYRTVTKKGIRVERGTFMAAELALYVGKQVFVRHDPDDMGRIYVFDGKQNFICEALNVERLDIDRKELAAKAKAAQKEYINEATKDIKRMARSFKPEDFIDGYLKDAAEAAENVISLPRKTEEHTSKGLTEAERAVFKADLPEKTKLDPRQEAAHQRLIQEMEKDKAAKPVRLETSKTRFTRALNLEKRLENGARISAEDQKWLEGYKQTPEYRSQKAMLEDFGSSWLEKGDTNAP